MTNEWTYTNGQMLLDYDCALLTSYDPDVTISWVRKARVAVGMLQEAILGRMNGSGTDEWESAITTRVSVAVDRPAKPLKT